MLFPRSFFLALLSAPLLAFAQDEPNAFIFADGSNLQATAGQPLALAWSPTTDGTISLILRSGNSANLDEGMTIASKIANSGHYTWNVPDSVTRGSDYTIEIVSDADSSESNYTPYFVIESTNTVASSTAYESLGAPTTSLRTSTVSPTASPSAFPLASGITIDTSSHPSSGSGAVSATSTDSSATTSSGSTATTMSTATSSAASASNTAESTGSSSTESSNGGAARATAMAGMLGVIALGALAL